MRCGRVGTADGPLLLLLHGMAGTADVWSRFGDALQADGWSGTWVAVDLAGHGQSPRRGRYSFGTFAADVSETLTASGLAQDQDVIVVGHSMGAAVGLVLATGWFALQVRGCLGIGLKVSFTEEETARAQALAAKPGRRFDSAREAASFWLRLAGLDCLIEPDDPMVNAALVRVADGWELSFDNAANGVAGIDAAQLLATSQARVLLTRGDTDPMVSTAEIEALGCSSFVFEGAGHNVHVEQPHRLVELLTAGAML